MHGAGGWRIPNDKDVSSQITSRLQEEELFQKEYLESIEYTFHAFYKAVIRTAGKEREKI